MKINLFFLLLVISISTSLYSQWQIRSSMNSTRSSHTATLLEDGRILVTGGYDVDSSLKSCEIYDPAADQWTQTAPLFFDRFYHTATLLEDGRVLVSGGYSLNEGKNLKSCEIFDPADESWSLTDSLLIDYNIGTTTSLNNGSVLTFGENYSDSVKSQIYTPAAETWSRVNSPVEISPGYASAKLNNGQVMVFGGWSMGRDDFVFDGSCRIFDTNQNIWIVKNSYGPPRAYHTLTTMANGDVLLAGGLAGVSYQASFIYTSDCYLYKPESDSWAETDSLNQSRRFHRSVKLMNNDILIIGGRYTPDPNDDFHELSSCEIYSNGEFTVADSLNTGRYGHEAVLLPDGNVFVCGGTVVPDSDEIILKSCELYIPQTTDAERNYVVRKFQLYNNYPNPFNPVTTISFEIPSRMFVSLKVFDALGKEILTIVSDELSAGTYSRELNSAGLPSGAYFYRLQSGSFTETKKLLLLK